MDEPTLEYRIGWISGCLVLSIAIIGDLLQVLLSLTVVLSPGGDIVTVIAEGFITFYFVFKKVSFFRGKKALGRILGLMATSVIELVPIVDALPTLTVDTIYNIYSARAEDRMKFNEAHEQWVMQARKEEEDEAYARAVLAARIRNAQEAQEAADSDYEDA